jgi:DoxX-like family
VALLVPRVRAGWPAIGAIALAVVLAHSGVLHLDASPEVAEHYRNVLGSDGWTRTVGILQLVAAGGLWFARTRAATAAAFAAVVLIVIGNQLRTDRATVATLTSLLLLVWAVVVAWGEARRAAARADR